MLGRYAIDLSREDAAQIVYDTCKEKSWGIDVLINNAGFGGQGDFTSERTMEQDLLEPFISYNDAMWDYFEPELHRRLSDENTTFQKQLNSTREVLALHYINNTDMTTNDIAYLLGYAELNSFLRAFSVWTGKSISEYKGRGGS